MKKLSWAFLIILILLIIFIVILRPGGEDSWIKDERGVWIKHGSPSKTPDYVKEQQQLISESLNLYGQKKSEGIEFSSQCLGTIEDYVVDIVHVPRVPEDNLVENKCGDYRTGVASHFIELDKDGNIVRIV